MKLTLVLSALLALAVALPADCGPGGNGINKGEKGPGKKGPGEKRPDEERQGQTRNGKKEGEDHEQRERDKPKEAHGGKYVASNRDFSPASNSSAEESSRGNPPQKTLYAETQTSEAGPNPSTEAESRGKPPPETLYSGTLSTQAESDNSTSQAPKQEPPAASESDSSATAPNEDGCETTVPDASATTNSTDGDIGSGTQPFKAVESATPGQAQKSGTIGLAVGLLSGLVMLVF